MAAHIWTLSKCARSNILQIPEASVSKIIKISLHTLTLSLIHINNKGGKNPAPFAIHSQEKIPASSLINAVFSDRNRPMAMKLINFSYSFIHYTISQFGNKWGHERYEGKKYNDNTLANYLHHGV